MYAIVNLVNIISQSKFNIIYIDLSAIYRIVCHQPYST